MRFVGANVIPKGNDEAIVAVKTVKKNFDSNGDQCDDLKICHSRYKSDHQFFDLSKDKNRKNGLCSD